TRLYYYRARYYDPRLRRFLNEDPKRFQARDRNLYRYAGNKPIQFVDPTGKDEDTIVTITSISPDEIIAEHRDPDLYEPSAVSGGSPLEVYALIVAFIGFHDTYTYKPSNPNAVSGAELRPSSETSMIRILAPEGVAYATT